MSQCEPYLTRERKRRCFHLAYLIREMGVECKPKGLSILIGGEVLFIF